MKRKKFLIRKRHMNFGRVSGEKEKNARKIPNGLKISRGNLNTIRNKRKYKLYQKRLRRY